MLARMRARRWPDDGGAGPRQHQPLWCRDGPARPGTPESPGTSTRAVDGGLLPPTARRAPGGASDQGTVSGESRPF
jgi:hypothetical protein